MSRAVVFCGGKIGDYTALPFSFRDDDYVVCADSGIEHCIELGKKVDLWVGDFDSADYSTYAECQLLKNAEIVRLNPQKDDTDTEHALDCVIGRGYDDLVLIGATGGSRFDHSLANVFVLEKYTKHNISLAMIDENNAIHLLKDGVLKIFKTQFKYVSILPLEKSVVSCEGFVYPLNNEVMFRSSTRGMSNELTDTQGTITVHSGCVLVVESKD